MTKHLRPYPAYKDSGLPWLGQIPEHWDCLPHRVLFQEIKNQGHINEALLSVTISKGVLKQSDLISNSSKKDSSNLDKSKYKLVEPGDIAYNKMRAWQGAFGVSRYRGIVSPAYIVVRNKRDDNPDFFHFLFRTPGFKKEAERWSYGITSDMWSLRPEHFKMIYSCVPHRSEQNVIVRFLGAFDKIVRTYIRNRRKLIAVLNAQKKAVVNQIITHGVDPGVRVKSSGVDWFGDIPEHWSVTSLGKLVESFKTGPFGSLLHQSDYISGGTPIINPVHMCNQYIVPDQNCSVDKIAAKRLQEYSLEEGDFVFARRGELGRCAIVQKNQTGWLLGTGSIRARLKHADIITNFLLFALQCQWVKDYFSLVSVGATMQNLNTGILARLPLLLPPKKEQRLISEVLEQQMPLIHKGIRKIQNEIDLVREYRIRLISDVATGKIDVRHLSPEASDEMLDELDLKEDIEDEEPLNDVEPDEEGADADD